MSTVRMVNGMSESILMVSRNSGIYQSNSLCRSRSDSNLMNNTQLYAGLGRQCIWPKDISRLFLTSQPKRPRQRSLKAEAGWFGRESRDGKKMGAISERSETANEDILIFFFQLDLATRAQCALNMEQYEVAQQFRNKLAEVESEVIQQREAKSGSTSKGEAQDKAISILRLRSNLQKAIENENYVLAAEIRDQISNLETESLAASAKALAFENVQYAFRLGQKVRHKLFGYRAIICGMDPVCCESSSWMETANVAKLVQGSNQPFYQCRSWLMYGQTQIYSSLMFPRKICWPLINQTWVDLTTPIFPSYFTELIQQETSSP
ncbi:clp protease adapter protein ClpF, chloroplastic-like isoform X2 [Papaver somniferum]|uniref:clp protease adapter protein ClpF, chloroplastic-like isoform X2 n=1 Tax=Papaver somniferum TaxID=3469 RepID=UPI000E6FE7B7|nr:clp protease adapter protein ClpF, chloroplastic-like isoform X2 [Papaver somniferum]